MSCTQNIDQSYIFLSFFHSETKARHEKLYNKRPFLMEKKSLMMKRVYVEEFKEKVILEAISVEKVISEVAQKY